MPSNGTWSEIYRAAVLEADGSIKQERIIAARLAIAERLRETPSVSEDEQEAVGRALRSLVILELETRSWFMTVQGTDGHRR